MEEATARDNGNGHGKLKLFEFHGVDFGSVSGEDHSAECPWCGKDKFAVNEKTSQWQCFVCGERGNDLTFLRKLHRDSFEYTKEFVGYKELAADRKLLEEGTLEAWGVAKSLITKQWIVPGHDPSCKLKQLYRYAKINGKRRLLASPKPLGHQLFGISNYVSKKPIVYLTEGPWDGMALWEALSKTKRMDGKLAPTKLIERSLLKEANVLATPGCNVFLEDWFPLFNGKIVRICFDNDHPRKHPETGTELAPAGLSGVKRVARMLSGVAESIEYLKWGEEGYTTELPSGYDVRDYLSSEGGEESPVGRMKRLESLMGMIESVPEDWIGSTVKEEVKSGPSKGMECIPCDDYKVLVNSWKKAMKWTEGLDHGLTVMLASVASTKSVGDQLWVKVVGPASCGKSTLCEAISVNRRYVLAKSTIRGFHSGFRYDTGEGDGNKQDHSLIQQVSGKTLVTKDGDTLLQSPNLGQILSEARDLYDSTSRSHYRNAMSKDYEGIRMTWLLCGTSSLRQIDSSELGERFLDCVIMEGIDDAMEDEVAWRVVNRADRNLSLESNGKVESSYEPELAMAMQLTGGYVDYLRENAQSVMGEIDFPDEAKRHCIRLGKFIAHMRARPSLKQEETAEREFAARLVSQLARLAKCLAFVLNKRVVDYDVMKRVKRVAFDTSRGQTLGIVSHLYSVEDGLETSTLSMLVGRGHDKMRAMLVFMKHIGVVRIVQKVMRSGIKGKAKWCLTERMRQLYEDVKDIRREESPEED